MTDQWADKKCTDDQKEGIRHLVCLCCRMETVWSLPSMKEKLKNFRRNYLLSTTKKKKVPHCDGIFKIHFLSEIN